MSRSDPAPVEVRDVGGPDRPDVRDAGLDEALAALDAGASSSLCGDLLLVRVWLSGDGFDRAMSHGDDDA
jgi:hypothetical protein